MATRSYCMSLDYPLAKELKDAGFPINLMAKGCANCWGDLHQGCTDDCQTVELPTLEKLIEMCGKQLFTLQGSDDLGWTAVYGESYHASRCDAPPQRHNLGFFSQVEYWKIRPDRLRHIARRQMGVVLFGHAGVGVAELGGDDAHRHPAHGQM